MMKKYIYSVALLCAFTVTANAQATLQQTPKGTPYIVFTHSAGDKIKLNDVVTFHIVQKTDKDSLLASSYTAGHPAKLQVQAPEGINDPIVSRLMEIFPLVTLGDSVLVKISTDSLLKGHEESRPPFFPKGSFLNLYIKITNIQSLTDAIAERNAEMAKVKASEVVEANKYIADNKLVLKTTVSGLKYNITKTGLKPKPLAGDTVYVNYTGKLLNGKIFDTNIEALAKQAGLDQPGRPYQPINFPVGQQKVIAGWDEGLLLLNEGSKATFVIPSGLAYGETGSPDGGATIPPFSTLVFNVELVKVVRIKHAAPAAAKKPLAKKHTVAKHTTTTTKK
jgi:FKBP-type peptidyl-prolyl cis-trans isomerase FkpA